MTEKSNRAPRGGCLLLLSLTLFLFLAGLTALILYLVYRPSTPRFSVVAAAIYDLSNASSTSSPVTALSTSMQFTLVIRNPSRRATAFLDHLSAYVTYRGLPVTPPEPLPPVFQDPESTVAVSPVLGGGSVPVSPDAAARLAADQAYGVVGLRLVVMGRVRYKAGPFKGRWNGVHVRCDMLVGFQKGLAGPVPLLGEPECDVDV